MKYLVLRDCYGFKKRYWNKGTVVELDASEKPPHQFQPIAEAPKPKEPEKELKSFSEMAKAQTETDEKPVGMRAKPKKEKKD